MATRSIRSQAGLLGALSTHSRHSGEEITAAARAAFNARWERQVDPQGKLPEAERIRRAEYAKRAYFTRLALASAKARRKRSG
jgi:hypothetical protein